MLRYLTHIRGMFKLGNMREVGDVVGRRKRHKSRKVPRKLSVCCSVIGVINFLCDF